MNPAITPKTKVAEPLPHALTYLDLSRINLAVGGQQQIREGLRPFAVKTKTSASRDRVVASLRPAPFQALRSVTA